MLINYKDFNQVLYNILVYTEISVNYESANENEEFPYLTYRYDTNIEDNYKCTGNITINIWDNSGDITSLDKYITLVSDEFEKVLYKPIYSENACYRFYEGTPGQIEIFENNLAMKSIQFEYSFINFN